MFTIVYGAIGQPWMKSETKSFDLEQRRWHWYDKGSIPLVELATGLCVLTDKGWHWIARFRCQI